MKFLGATLACVLVALVLASPFAAAAQPGAAAPTNGRVLLVVIDRIGIDDIVAAGNSIPNIRRLMAAGGAGLMNARARFGPYSLENYAVIGAGGRVQGAEHAALAFNTSENVTVPPSGPVFAGTVYKELTGISPPGGSIVNLGIESIIEASKTAQSTSTAGLLGTCLADAGKKARVLGNADYIGTPSLITELLPATKKKDPFPSPDVAPGGIVPQRQISCISMDESGIAAGDVSNTFWTLRPGSTDLKTDFARLTSATDAALKQSDFVAVDMGETSRVDQKSGLVPDSRLAVERIAALARCDAALGRMMASVDLSRDLVIVCTPTPTKAMVANNDLFTPLVIAGPGFAKGGSLNSTTTRRTALVSNYDIAPTVLGFLNTAVPAEMEGAPISTVAKGTSIASLQALRDKAGYLPNAHGPYISVFVYAAIGILVLLMVLIWVDPSLLRGHLFIWLTLLFCLLWLPVVYQVLPLFTIRLPAVTAALAGFMDIALAILTVAVTALFARRSASPAKEAGDAIQVAVPGAIAAVMLVTLGVIAADPLLGSSMISFSPFGAAIAGGGRYYGIGNVYMGIALGAAVVLACLVPVLMPRLAFWKQFAVAAVILFVTIVVIGSSRLGANVGGLLAGVAGATVTLALFSRDRRGWKRWAFSAAVVLVFLVIFFAAEMLLPGPASHAGKMVSRVQARGASDLWAVVSRKLQVDWKLFWTSTWRLLFFASIAFGLLWFRKPPVYKAVSKRYPMMRVAWWGLIATVVAGIAFNDTGIETAGALALYFVVPTIILYLVVMSLHGDGVNYSRETDSAPPASDQGGP